MQTIRDKQLKVLSDLIISAFLYPRTHQSITARSEAALAKLEEIDRSRYPKITTHRAFSARGYVGKQARRKERKNKKSN